MTMTPIRRRTPLFVVLLLVAVPANDVNGFMLPLSSHFTVSRNANSLPVLAATIPPPQAATVDTAASAKDLPYGEVSRQFRRTFFTHDDWVYHRGSDRFLSNLCKIFTSGVVRQMSIEISLVTAIALGTCLWNAMFVTGFQDYSGIMHAPLASLPLISLPLEPFTLSSPALGLLLVFRTNASYGRWSEARRQWGAIVNHSRNIVRLASAWSLDDALAVGDNEQSGAHASTPTSHDHEEQLELLANTVWCFSRSLQRHLLGPQDEDAFRQAIEETMPPEFAQKLIAARHRPTRTLFELTCLVNSLPLPYLRRNEIDKSLVSLTEVMGGCERIFSSPVPLVYTRHTARFLGLWILCLPAGLWHAFGSSWNHLELVPVSMIISFFFLGIEELAVQLEEPFSILPLDQLVNNIRLSMNEHVEWHVEAVAATTTIASKKFTGNAESRFTDTLPKTVNHSNALNHSHAKPFIETDFPLGREAWDSHDDAM